jgi:hypothetical protein
MLPVVESSDVSDWGSAIAGGIGNVEGGDRIRICSKDK